MKYKVGDKARIVGNKFNHQFRIGSLVKIKEKSENGYLCEGIDKFNTLDTWYVSEEDIISIDYTWEDFLKAPIGTRVTFEDNTILVKSDANRFDNESECATYEFIESFNKEDGFGKVIKIEEPTYITVYEAEEVKEMTIAELENELGYKIKVVKEK